MECSTQCKPLRKIQVLNQYGRHFIFYYQIICLFLCIHSVFSIVRFLFTILFYFRLRGNNLNPEEVEEFSQRESRFTFQPSARRVPGHNGPLSRSPNFWGALQCIYLFFHQFFTCVSIEEGTKLKFGQGKKDRASPTIDNSPTLQYIFLFCCSELYGLRLCVGNKRL